MARVTYRTREDLPEKSRFLFDNLQNWSGYVGNVFRALGNAPHILRGVMVLGTAVLNKSRLDPRIRELAIIRVGQINQADYERAHHVEIGRKNGVTEADLENLSSWQSSSHFSEKERAVLRYTEEVTRSARPEPATMDELKKHFDDAGIVEVVAAVSFYNMMCRVLNSLDVDLEPEYEQYRNRYR
ncbi:MAG TPA: carboxymuconolactone decarboxylase family protein [Dehalococcoidia bacterium]|nr:carboxymuconolactone decarboxylase family protein [Dehalococcoidia bacterium]